MPEDITPPRRRGRPPRNPVQVLQLDPEEMQQQRYTPRLDRDLRPVGGKPYHPQSYEDRATRRK